MNREEFKKEWRAERLARVDRETAKVERAVAGERRISILGYRRAAQAQCLSEAMAATRVLIGRALAGKKSSGRLYLDAVEDLCRSSEIRQS